MNKSILFLSLVTLPFYSIAYVLAYMFNMRDKEDMMTIKEWMTLCFEKEEE